MSEYAKTLLAGVLPDDRARAIRLLQDLQPEHFVKEYRAIFQMLDRYYSLTGAIFTRDSFIDLLKRSHIEPEKILQYEEVFDELSSLSPEEHEWRYALHAIKDARSETLVGEAIVTSMKILMEGAVLDGKWKSGHQDARDHLYGALSSVDRLSTATAPEGDIRTEAMDIKADYASRKAGKLGVGIESGLRQLDMATGGFQRGDLVFIAGYTGQYKTTFCSQLAWHASIVQGKNVFFATSETLRAQVRRKIIARHSRQPQFDYAEGLNSKDLKQGTLTPEQENVFNHVVADLSDNPTYGKLYIAQVPRGATLGYIEARLARCQQAWNVDLLIIDYLALLKPDRHRSKQQEELNDLIKDSKVLAASFADGRGIPVISPWAMSQTAWTNALRSGFYQLANLAETSEAEKSADVILAVLALPDTPNEVKLGVLKNRDGEVPEPFTVNVDAATSSLSTKIATGGLSSLIDEDE